MKNLNLALLSIIILLTIFTPNFAQTTDVYSCVTDLVINEAPKKPGISRAVFQPSKKWIPGQQVRVISCKIWVISGDITFFGFLDLVIGEKPGLKLPLSRLLIGLGVVCALTATHKIATLQTITNNI